jgi:hypothetical protein
LAEHSPDLNVWPDQAKINDARNETCNEGQKKIEPYCKKKKKFTNICLARPKAPVVKAIVFVNSQEDKLAIYLKNFFHGLPR